jgi:hypothetical protein
MALIEKSTITEITTLLTGEIQIMTKNTVEKDGEVLSSKTHYDMLQPGASLDGIDPKVCAIAGVVWTPEVIAAYKAQVEQSKLGE